MQISDEVESRLEASLNDFDAQLRREALVTLNGYRQADAPPADSGIKHNMHCHTFYSYNGYGYSPSYIAWWAAKENLFAAGTVDFDVLDAVDEFLEASKLLNIRGVCGIETRAFFPEYAEKELNSPGEPGIAYHMGVGFCSGTVPAEVAPFLANLREKASERTRNIVKAVNAYLAPVELDYSTDVEALTPGGNATERHVCSAYFRKAEDVFPEESARISFWSEKLNTAPETMAELIGDRVKLEGLIRSKTMKAGGAGYVKADPKSFPPLKDMNNFISCCGAIPTIAWLDGFSAGEKDVDALLDTHIANGARALGIVPDRNWNLSDKELAAKKVSELNRVVEAALKRDMPIVVGTEMNAPGLKLVDDFDNPALAPHAQTFADGAAIAFAHTLLQPLGKGYGSEWAEKTFASGADRNRFFAALGTKARPCCAESLAAAGDSPQSMLAAITKK
ncbi:MAG: hypothetical protein JXR78_06340 [Victivallales bacterium]|nr:hypothetical protein [Victivallales bacterium]